MSVLEYSERFARMGFFANKVHNCKICSFFSTLVFRMVNHVRTHRSPLTHFNCEKANIEMYYCKDCNFQTYLTVLMKKHIESRHSSDSQNEENISQNFICRKCKFETYFTLKWLQHMKACVYRKRHSKLKSVKVGKIKTAIKAKFRCGRCCYKFIRRESLNIHKITKHLKREKILWYHCEKCPYKSPHKAYLRSHMYQHVNHNQLKTNSHKCGKYLCKTKLLKEHSLQTYAAENLTVDNSVLKGKPCSYKTQSNLKRPNTRPSANGTKCVFKYKQCSYKPQFNLKRPDRRIDKNGIKWYECSRCSFRAKLAETLEKHTANFHKYKFVCDQCLYKYRTFEDLQEHTLRTHLRKIEASSNSEKPEAAWYHCKTCKFITKSVKLLNEHTCRHQAEKEKNIIIDHQTKRELFECNQCPFTSINKKYLQQHVRLKHRNANEIGIGWSRCSKCPYRVKNKCKLDQHVSKFHPDNETSVNSEKTEDSDDEASTAYNEASFNSEKGTAWYHCRDCKFVTRSIEMLNKHLACGKHQAEKEKFYKCDKCAYKTKTNNELKQHKLKYHLNMKVTAFSRKSDPVWYKCAFCEFKATSIAFLIGHTISEHQAKKELYKCAQCSYTAKIGSELNQHILKYHPDNQPTHNSEKVDTVWHKCDLCDFKTNSIGIINSHIIKHQTTKTQLYNSGQCSYKTLTNKSNLQRQILPKLLNEDKRDDETVCYQGINKDNLPPLVLLTPPSENKNEWFKCGVCDFKTKVVGDISTHIISKHAK